MKGKVCASLSILYPHSHSVRVFFFVKHPWCIFYKYQSNFLDIKFPALKKKRVYQVSYLILAVKRKFTLYFAYSIKISLLKSQAFTKNKKHKFSVSLCWLWRKLLVLYISRFSVYKVSLWPFFFVVVVY